MKKKSIIYSDLSKKQLETLKELYIQKKVESMSHQELKQYVLEIISHQINDTIGKEEEMEAWREMSDFFGEQFEINILEIQTKYIDDKNVIEIEKDSQKQRIELLERNNLDQEKKDMWDDQNFLNGVVIQKRQTKICFKKNVKINQKISGSHGLIDGGGVHDEHTYKVVGSLKRSGTVVDRLLLTSVNSVLEIHGLEDIDHDTEHNHDHKSDQSSDSHHESHRDGKHNHKEKTKYHNEEHVGDHHKDHKDEQHNHKHSEKH